MRTVSRRANPIRSLGVIAILLAIVLTVLVVGSVANASFHLDYAPGVEQGGIHMSRVVAQEDVVAYKGRTAAVSVSRPTQAVQRNVVARASGGCYAEPGTPPASVMMRESGGDPKVWNGGEHYKLPNHSTASGCWGFIKGTWNNYGGYANAADAPVAVQNAKAKEVYAGGAGRSHWRQTCC